jgi:hypothetical protein
MSDDDIEDDELDDVEATEDSDDTDLPDSDEDTGPAVKTRKKAVEEDPLEGLSLEAKAREREMLARQMEEFMARGGQIQQIDDNVIGDPPKKPDGKYGSRPI